MRWSSNGEDEGGGKNQKRIGFIENFISNLQRGLKKNEEMQDSLKGLREERERMQKSYILQQWKEQAGEGWKHIQETGRRSWENVREGLKKTKDGLSKVILALNTIREQSLCVIDNI